MRVRVEIRPARRIPTPKPNSPQREARDHLRGLLILDNKRRVALATVSLPLMGEDDVALLLRRSAPKLRRFVPDDRLFHLLLGQLAAAAEPHRLAVGELERRRSDDDLLASRGWALVRRGTTRR